MGVTTQVKNCCSSPFQRLRLLQLGQNCIQLVRRGGRLHSGEDPITLPIPYPFKKKGQQSTRPAVVMFSMKMAAVWLGG